MAAVASVTTTSRQFPRHACSTVRLKPESLLQVRPYKIRTLRARYDCPGTQRMLSINRVVPTQSAPAATTGPATCSTGWKFDRIDDLEVLEPEARIGRNLAGGELFQVAHARDAVCDGVLHLLECTKQGRSQLPLAGVEALVS